MVYTHTKIYSNNEVGIAGLSLKLDLIHTMKSSSFLSSGGLDLFIIWTEDFRKSLRSWRSNGGTSARDRYTGMLFSVWVCFAVKGEFQKSWTLTAITNPAARASLQSHQRSAYIFKKIPGIIQPSKDSDQAAWGCACPCPHFVTPGSGCHPDQSVTSQRDGSSLWLCPSATQLLVRVQPLLQANLVSANPQL